MWPKSQRSVILGIDQQLIDLIDLRLKIKPEIIWKNNVLCVISQLLCFPVKEGHKWNCCLFLKTYISLSFRWEEEYTMRMDLQQKIADLQEVRLCGPSVVRKGDDQEWQNWKCQSFWHQLNLLRQPHLKVVWTKLWRKHFFFLRIICPQNFIKGPELKSIFSWKKIII